MISLRVFLLPHIIGGDHMDEGLVPQAFNWIAVAIYSLILHTEAGAGIRGSISTILILER